MAKEPTVVEFYHVPTGRAVKRDDLLQVKTFGGRKVWLRFIELRGRSVVMTSDEEFHRAVSESRAPICIGFPMNDVVEVKSKAAFNK